MTDDATAVFADLFRLVGPHADHVYRALSKALHPDMGGDEDLMAALTAAHGQRELVSADRSRRSGGGVFRWPSESVIAEWEAAGRAEP